jgi:deazaflavin-dependent oxidoreductase (nitroreductase family)
MSGFNDRIIEEFRANGGVVTTAGFGSGLVLLHTVGARSGEERVSPVLAIPDNGGWLVIASAAGSPTHPAWYFNLKANPDASIEVGTETVLVSAADVGPEEYETDWAKFTGRSPGFNEYKSRAGGRVLPIVRLSVRGQS